MNDEQKNELSVPEYTCCVCGAHLSTRYNLYGKDYCAKHARDVPRSRIPGVWDETVRGTIIGTITTRYQFWRDDRKLCETDAETDSEAIGWFKANHPEQFKQGADMRALL